MSDLWSKNLTVQDKERIAILERKIDELTAILRPSTRFTSGLGLTKTQTMLLALLTERDFVTREQMYVALGWGGKSLEDRTSQLSAHIRVLRKKLEPHGIEIGTIYSEGYQVLGESKTKARAAIERGRTVEI